MIRKHWVNFQLSIAWIAAIAETTIAEIEPGSIPAIVIAAIAGISQVAEVWFPYNRWTNVSAILAISAIPEIDWKPGFTNVPCFISTTGNI